ncbi:UNVERIFIED_CONTAM: hypothetical protein ABIC26_000117 [Paenibacillus sp. PvR008]
MKPLDYNQLEQLARIVTDTPEDAVYSGPVAEWLESVLCDAGAE